MMAVKRIVAALVLLSSLGYSQLGLGEERATAVADSPGVHIQTEPLPFKQDKKTNEHAGLIIGLVLVILGGIASYIILLNRRQAFPGIDGQRIRVLEKKVLAPGLVSMVVEVKQESFLIVQDKHRHTVTRLKVQHEKQ